MCKQFVKELFCLHLLAIFLLIHCSFDCLLLKILYPLLSFLFGLFVLLFKLLFELLKFCSVRLCCFRILACIFSLIFLPLLLHGIELCLKLLLTLLHLRISFILCLFGGRLGILGLFLEIGSLLASFG